MCCVFVSGNVIRIGGGVLYAVATRTENPVFTALVNVRKPLQLLAGESTGPALGVVNKTSHAQGCAANPADKRTCLQPTVYFR